MRARFVLFLSAFAASTLSAGCPLRDDVPAEAIALAAPSPAPPVLPLVAPPLPAQATTSSAPPAVAVEPADLATLPPELVDDGSDDVQDPEPPPPVVHGEVDELASTAKETWIFAQPSWKARRIGYLRAGAIAKRSAEPVAKNSNCVEGWYRIEPRGYVCVGATATLNIFDPVVEASAKRPRRDGLPYTYVMSRSPPPPFYARLPSAEEALSVEPDLHSQLRKAARAALEPGYVAPPPAESVPGFLLYGRNAPGLSGTHRSSTALEIGHARGRSGFALLSTFDYEGRRYGVTTELAVLPLDRTRVIKPSTFSGKKLDDEVTLPVAFVRSHHASHYLSGDGGALTAGDAIGFREAIPITGKTRLHNGVSYLEARDGSLIREEQTVRVDSVRRAPAWASGKRRWIDVSILKQTLVAYEGTKPVYTTLVSTGADGLGDPKKTHSTIQGAFLIHTKHLSVTMDDDRIGDEFDFRDVPFVQYFTEGFAFHAAYWHDEFGTPRSHGCVNLAPIDAAWLFNWTLPEVPPEWHGALSLKKGTLVFIHP